jgi:hypothetical protein
LTAPNTASSPPEYGFEARRYAAHRAPVVAGRNVEHRAAHRGSGIAHCARRLADCACGIAHAGGDVVEDVALHALCRTRSIALLDDVRRLVGHQANVPRRFAAADPYVAAMRECARMERTRRRRRRRPAPRDAIAFAAAADIVTDDALSPAASRCTAQSHASFSWARWIGRSGSCFVASR